MSDKLVIIVQARLGSSRYPGKVVVPLLGQPMLLWLLMRLARLALRHTTVVACPPGPANAPLLALCRRHGYRVMAPEVPEDDVLARFAAVAAHYDADLIVRLCGDCPCLDPVVVHTVITAQQVYGRTAALTAIAPEWPDGMDCEIVTRGALAAAHAEATAPSEREHVTSFLYNHPDRFCGMTVPCPLDLQEVRWTVDTPQDLPVLETLVKRTVTQYGCWYGWQDLWATMMLNATLRDRLTVRPGTRNRAYCEQVARERGTPVQSWETLRYKELRHG